MSRAKLYEVEIEPARRDGERFTISYAKLHGDRSSGCNGVKSKAELLAFLREVFRQWEEYDSILDRRPEKVTKRNLHFESFTPDVSVVELFGNTTMAAFLKPPQAEEVVA